MKNYQAYVKHLKENYDNPLDLTIPGDDELLSLYPELEPWQARQKWYNERSAEIDRSRERSQSMDDSIQALKIRERKEILSKLSDMIALAQRTEDDQFLSELISLMEKYPNLVRKVDTTKIVST